MQKIAICTAICLWFAGVAYGDGPRPPVERRHLDKPSDIQSYPCARGVAWFYDSGVLESCRTAREASFGEAHVPAGSWIHLTSDGQPDFVLLRHDTRIDHYTCRGKGHNFTTAFFPSGKLQECRLADDEEIQGVPCGHGGFFGDVFGGGSGTEFYENGKLRRCRLWKPAMVQDKRFASGARVAFDEDGRIK